MDVFIGLTLLLLGSYTVKTLDERRRIDLLSARLRPYQLEQLIAELLEGYLRALDEQDDQRSSGLWKDLSVIESRLSEQMQAFATDLSGVWGEKVRVSRLPVSVPLVTRLLPALGFDLRPLVALHARAVDAAVRNEAGLQRRDQAFRLSAELLLFQHTCHWYCRSLTLASARLLARHRSPYAQVLEAVAPETRRDYLALISR
jgi:hypothetical protein